MSQSTSLSDSSPSAPPVSSPVRVHNEWDPIQEIVVGSKSEDDPSSAFKSWGLAPIECPFRELETIGGDLRCASVDIRRRGELQSYF